MKKIDTYKLHQFLTATWICCYGIAITSLFSLLLLIAPEEYLDTDSKGWNSTIKHILADNPKFVIYTVFISAASGVTIHVLDKILEKKA